MINFTITDDKNEASHTHGTTSINIATHVYTSWFKTAHNGNFSSERRKFSDFICTFAMFTM
jgi:hypothetical protein